MNSLKKQLPGLVGFAVFLSAAILLFKFTVDRHGMVRSIRIGDIAGATNQFKFNCPKAAIYHFLIGLNADGSWEGGTQNGYLELQTVGHPPIRLGFSNEVVGGCNWLDQQGLTGVILNGTTNRVLEGSLIPNQRYDLSLVFSSSVPTNASLWLYVGQTHRDWRNYKE